MKNKSQHSEKVHKNVDLYDIKSQVRVKGHKNANLGDKKS